MSKVLVTGGAGFIGSHLCEALLRQDDEVVVVDDLSTGRMENILHLQEKKGFHFVEGSILDFPLLESVIKKVDSVFHLAAVVGVERIIAVPVEAIEINVLGSHNVLTLASRYNKLCLITSTSEVYGKSTKQPFTEDDDVVYGPTTKSRWSYACSKAIDEFLGLAYHNTQNLPVVIARLFNTTGPRQTGRYGMVLPRFVEQALRGEPITVFGSGRQTRCFADVSDVVRALLLLAEHPAAVGQVFNVGNPEEISIGELAKLVKKQTRSESEIKWIPYDEAYQPGFEDMERRVPNIAKASRLGYTPKIKLREIISRVVASKQGELEPVELPVTMGLRAHPLRAGVAE
jgi:UDP-glucose 4-epimerase